MREECLIILYLSVVIRTLFKFMKKFEAVLDEPCQAALVESNKEEQLDCLEKQEEFGSKESQIQRLNSVLRRTLSAKTEVVQVCAFGTLNTSQISSIFLSPSLLRWKCILIRNSFYSSVKTG